MTEWILPALLSPFLFSIVTLVDKRILSHYKLNLSSFNLFVGLSQGIIGIVILFVYPIGFVDWSVFFRGILTGIIQGVALIIMFWMLKREDPTRVMPIMQTTPLFVALLAWPFFGEMLSFIQWAAVIIAISGGILVSIGRRRFEDKTTIRPIFFLLFISAALIGISQLVIKSITTDLISLHIVALRGIGLCTMMFFVFGRKDSAYDLFNFLKFPKRAVLLVSVEGITPFICHLLTTFAISIGPVSLVATMFGVRPIFVFLLSLLGARFMAKFVYEKFSKNELKVKLLSSVAVFLAIALMSFG